jgi:3-hydroxy-D-aspartate aldolase
MSSSSSSSFSVRPAPAVVGDGLDAVQTPALILDKDALLANLRRLPALLRESSTQVRIRPHFKAHKCGAIAQLQLEEGEASGFCFQKVSELEGLVRHFEAQQRRGGGWQLDLLVTNEVVERSKLRRLCELARHPEVARVGVAVDDVGVLDVLMEEAHRTPSGAARVGVVIEIDVGQQRCGIDIASAEGQAAFVELARRLMAAHRDPSGRVSFIGLQAYHGGAVLRTNVCVMVCMCVCAHQLTHRTFREPARTCGG